MNSKIHFRQLFAEQLERREMYAADMSIRFDDVYWRDHDFHNSKQSVARFADQSLSQSSDRGDRPARLGDRDNRPPRNSGPHERGHHSNFGSSPLVSFSRHNSFGSQPGPPQRRSDPPSGESSVRNGESPAIGLSLLKSENQIASMDRDLARLVFAQQPPQSVIVRIVPQFSVASTANVAFARVTTSVPAAPKLNATSTDLNLIETGAKSNSQFVSSLLQTELAKSSIKSMGNQVTNQAGERHSFVGDGSDPSSATLWEVGQSGGSLREPALVRGANHDNSADRFVADPARVQTGLIEFSGRSLDALAQSGKPTSQPWKLSSKTLQGLKAIGQGNSSSLYRNQPESTNDHVLASWFNSDLGLIELDIRSSRPIGHTFAGQDDLVAAHLDSVMGLYRFVETLEAVDDASESPGAAVVSSSEFVASFVSLTNSDAYIATAQSDHLDVTANDAVKEEEPRFKSFFKHLLATSLLTLLSSRLLRKRGKIDARR